MTTKPNLPLGYWLKHTDEVLTKHINDAQSVNGISRSQWQILNTLYEVEAATKEQIFETMQTFVSKVELENILTDFKGRSWLIQNEQGSFQLTDEARVKHQTILEAQKKVRQRAMQGISEHEYGTVMSVLQRIIENLEEKKA